MLILFKHVFNLSIFLIHAYNVKLRQSIKNTNSSHDPWLRNSHHYCSIVPLYLNIKKDEIVFVIVWLWACIYEKVSVSSWTRWGCLDCKASLSQGSPISTPAQCAPTQSTTPHLPSPHLPSPHLQTCPVHTFPVHTCLVHTCPCTPPQCTPLYTELFMWILAFTSSFSACSTSTTHSATSLALWIT